MTRATLWMLRLLFWPALALGWPRMVELVQPHMSELALRLLAPLVKAVVYVLYDVDLG